MVPLLTRCEATRSSASLRPLVSEYDKRDGRYLAGTPEKMLSPTCPVRSLPSKRANAVSTAQVQFACRWIWGWFPNAQQEM